MSNSEGRGKSKQIVTQDNQLIEACYTMSLNEKRILMLGISKCNSTEWPVLGKPLQFSITAEEWTRFYPDENPWRAMKRAADTLLTRYLTLHPKTGITEKISWFDRVVYHENEARMSVEFGRSMQVRLMGMLENFTKVDLLAINTLNSLYSIRLYELLNQFRSTGFRVLSVDGFRYAMDCKDVYPTVSELKRRVLIPAIKEVNERTDIKISLTDGKAGRKITHFKFKFSPKKKPVDENQLDLLADSSPETGEFIAKHADRSWADGMK